MVETRECFKPGKCSNKNNKHPVSVVREKTYLDAGVFPSHQTPEKASDRGSRAAVLWIPFLLLPLRNRKQPRAILQLQQLHFPGCSGRKSHNSANPCWGQAGEGPGGCSPEPSSYNFFRKAFQTLRLSSTRGWTLQILWTNTFGQQKHISDKSSFCHR